MPITLPRIVSGGSHYESLRMKRSTTIAQAPSLSRAMENCPLGATRNCPLLG
jgi:hypothetical protein